MLAREFKELYGAYREQREKPLPELEVQYADFAAVAAGEHDGGEHGGADEVLEGAVGRAGGLELPTDHPRPAVVRCKGAMVKMELGEELTRRIRRVVPA